jgi:secondary thiamine-phosphate synthase enzyme
MVYNTLKLLCKIYDLPIYPDERFESKVFSSYNSNKFMVLIFIACLPSLCYERTDEALSGVGTEMIETIQIRTSAKTDLIDITRSVEEAVRKSGVKDGICWVYVPHTTAAVTINENADPSVSKDILMELNKIVPFQDRYQHLEGNSPAHIKASLIGSSVTVFVQSGRLVLGTWQGIFFCEFDGPRNRQVFVKVLKGDF